MRAKVVTVMRWYVQDEVNQEDSEQNEVDGMKKGAVVEKLIKTTKYNTKTENDYVGMVKFVVIWELVSWEQILLSRGKQNHEKQI